MKYSLNSSTLPVMSRLKKLSTRNRDITPRKNSKYLSLIPSDTTTMNTHKNDIHPTVLKRCFFIKIKLKRYILICSPYTTSTTRWLSFYISLFFQTESDISLLQSYKWEHMSNFIRSILFVFEYYIFKNFIKIYVVSHLIVSIIKSYLTFFISWSESFEICFFDF